MILKLGMDHRGLNAYNVFFLNYDPGLTLTYFKARSSLVNIAFLCL